MVPLRLSLNVILGMTQQWSGIGDASVIQSQQHNSRAKDREKINPNKKVSDTSGRRLRCGRA